MTGKTVFAKIADGELPADKVFEDEHCLAFKDIDPKAPVHILVIPRRPLVSLADCGESESGLLGHLMVVAARVAREHGLEDGGYRVVTNIGADGGQSVAHLHLHVLGGRALGWPPG